MTLHKEVEREASFGEAEGDSSSNPDDMTATANLPFRHVDF